jgi:plastocyanin
MKGVVHVRPQGTPYRYTQQDYNRMGHRQGQALLHRGWRAWQDAKVAHPAKSGQVQVGIDGPGYAVMRFVRTHAVVHVGQTVTFSVAGPGAPHTVTFGEEPPGLGILPPSGDPTSYAGGDLNSGVIAPGAPFVVTFTKAGTFAYICAIHDEMGMVGDVTVLP